MNDGDDAAIGTTMTAGDETTRRAAAVYDAAADHYDDPANSFWDRFGRRTIERLNLQPGMRVLDVCCGTGASAIPAAMAVGPHGTVAGVDLAESPLDLARAKARRRNLTNVSFQRGDLLDLAACGNDFDAVVCVFGIFFVPDMTAAVRQLWGRTAPGGRLAITTWGPRFGEPGSTMFWDAVRTVRPALYRGFNPWDRITDPGAVRALLTDAGVADPVVAPEAATHTLDDPDAWWSFVLGTGYRGTIAALTAEERETVRRLNLAAIQRENVTAVDVNLVYATAHRRR